MKDLLLFRHGASEGHRTHLLLTLPEDKEATTIAVFDNVLTTPCLFCLFEREDVHSGDHHTWKHPNGAGGRLDYLALPLPRLLHGLKKA